MPQSILTPISQKLRREATKEENQLWYQFLRSHQVSFRRQKVIGRYIVDFYCPSAKLVIELDGSQHFEEKNLANEIKRQNFLKDKGYKVLRFINSDIWFNFSDVCRTIDAIVNPDNSNQYK
jgi:very-short-patch-repair endonuclease